MSVSTAPPVRRRAALIPAPLRRVPLARWELVGLVLLAIGAAIGFARYPTYPNYDSMYSLLWARELLDGQLPGFDDYRAPTEHPLWLAICLVLAPLGRGADRVLLAFCVLSFVASVAGLYRLGKVVFNPLVGLAAALLLLTRLDFPYLAARGYLDITYLALIVWAAALEAERPRRGAAVWLLLAGAGLLRPEAWVLAGLYLLYVGWRAPWAERARHAAWAALAPAVWAATDLVVTGDPMYSLNYTTESASRLGRRQEVHELPEVTLRYLAGLTKWPVLVAGFAGLALALRLAPRRTVLPTMLLLIGVGTFVAVSLRGFSVINRYLVLGALALMLFAAFALGGYAWLARGSRGRRAWAAGSLVLVVLAAGFSATNFNTRYIDEELALRDTVRTQMKAALASRAVRGARRCGPVSVPNHKLIPDARWLLDAGGSAVTARTARPRAGRFDRGAAIYLVGPIRFLRHPGYGPFDQTEDTPLIQVPGPDWTRGPRYGHFVVYTRC